MSELFDVERRGIDTAELRAIARDAWDVVVIGSGAGGGAAAWRLAGRGLRVLVLEKGPRLPKRALVPDEIGSCRRDAFVPYASDEPHVLREGSAPPKKTHEGWTSCCVGGGTVHMSAMLFRLHPEDFDARSRFGRPLGTTLEDWPIRYEHLAPYYDEVAAFVGVSGAPAENPFEPPSAIRTLPPLAAHPAASAVDRAARSLGLHPYPTPRGILSARREGEDHRGPCVGCGYCGSYACPVGAKASSADTFLHDAELGGRCRVVPGVMVAEILVDDRDRAGGVLALDGEGGRHRIAAPRVIVAASAVETPRLLLMSQPKRHPRGLGNAAAQVGSNLLVGLEAAGRAVFETACDLFAPSDDARPFIDRSVQDRYLDPGAPGAYPKAGTLVFERPHPNPILRASRTARGGGGAPAIGPALVAKLRRHFLEEREIAYESFVEMLPRPGARVVLDPAVVDRYGLPVARLELDDDASETPRAARLAELARGVLSALRPARIEEDAALRRTYFLQAGTCRMGSSPESSVCDELGRVRSIEGLAIADGSALPTMGGVPPTLTIMANALRIADAIAAERG